MSGIVTPSGLSAGVLWTPGGATVAGGSGTTTTAWADRGVGAADGDWLVESTYGATYRWHASLGLWIRPWVYAGTPVVDARVDGDVVPSSESPAWTQDTTVSGSITSDGTKVTCSAGAGDRAQFYFQHSQTDKNHWLSGYIATTTLGGNTPNSRHIYVSTGTRLVELTFSDVAAAGLVRIADTAQNIYTAFDLGRNQAAPASESFFEMFITTTNVMVFWDWGTEPVLAGQMNEAAASAGQYYSCGDSELVSGSNITTWRELLCGRW